LIIVVVMVAVVVSLIDEKIEENPRTLRVGGCDVGAGLTANFHLYIFYAFIFFSLLFIDFPD